MSWWDIPTRSWLRRAFERRYRRCRELEARADRRCFNAVIEVNCCDNMRALGVVDERCCKQYHP